MSQLADGARWCESHGRWECTKTRRLGARCHHPVMMGGATCRVHTAPPAVPASADVQATEIAAIIRAALADLGIDAADPTVREAVARAIRKLSAPL